MEGGGGGSWWVFVVSQFIQTKPSTFLKLGLQGYVGFFVLYYIVEEAKQIREMGFKAYFSEGLPLAL